MNTTQTIAAPGKPVRLSNVVTHRRPDGDELFAIWLLRSFARQSESIYPGASTAAILLFTEDTLPDGMSADNIPHMLFVGCGKGELDEHPRKDQNQCAATRVANKLGMRNDRALRRLLQMTLDEDRGRAKVTNSFGDALKLVSQRWIDDPQKTYEWAAVAYNAIYANDRVLADRNQLDQHRQLSLSEVKGMITSNVGRDAAERWQQHHAEACSWRDKNKNIAREIWKTTPIVNYVIGEEQTPVKLAFIESDNDQLNFISWKELGIGVFIQKIKQGNVQIYTKQDLGLCLRMVAELIRRREIELRNEKIAKENAKGGKTTPLTEMPNASRLRSTDTISEAPEWHLFNTSSTNKPILFNGNQITATNVTPTAIKLQEVVELTVKGLGLSKAPTAPAVQGFVNLGAAFDKTQV